MTTKIAFCTCPHEYQDKKYGKRKRLHNEARDGWTCTVCGKKKSK
jgi:hypothetical protein